MHMVAFKADPGTADTTPPSKPTGLTATPTSTSQINLRWDASTDDVGVAGYKVFRNGNQIATPTTTSYNDTGLAPNTTYDYTVSANDAAGNDSPKTDVVSAKTLLADTTAPTVSLTAPANGATVSGTINVTATASDNVGVVGVQFLLDGNNLGAEDATAPYSVAWNTSTATNGAHVSTARARDAAGNTTTSAARNVTVAAPDTSAPTVAITSPANNAQVGDIVNVTADAADNVGVAGVQFHVDGVDTGVEDTTAPYALAWDTRGVANGAHTLTARARDAAGNSTLSAAGHRQRRQHQLLPERGPRHRLRPADQHRVPARRPHAGRGAAGQDQGAAAALHAGRSRRRSCRSPTSASAGVQQGIYDIVLDPNFATNHYYYVFYTRGLAEPRPAVAVHRQRIAHRHRRRQRVRPLPGPAGRQRRASRRRPELRQRRQAVLHHRRALPAPTPSQELTSPRGKIHRINPDGTVPTDNPFYDGAGPNFDSIWALRPAQPVPRLLRRADRTGSSSATSAATTTRRPRRRSTSARAAPTTAGPTAKAPARRPCTQPDLLLRPQRSRRVDHRRVRLPRDASSRQRTRAATSSPTTPRTGSSA